MADKGLKGGSLGLVAVIVIGVASTAPGYSLAAGIGGIAAQAGAKAPFIMLFAFVPMGCIAAAFYYLNKADPDCGTNFTWGVRAFGPKAGWLSGWGCIVADLVIMPNLAGISGQYLVLLIHEQWVNNIYLTTAIGMVFIVLMCWICFTGIELSARSQVILLGTELIVLAVFAVMAITKAFHGVTRTVMVDSTDANNVTTQIPKVYNSIKPSFSWLSPSGLTTSQITGGLVLAVFVYWGWDTCVSVNEEAKDSTRTPGIAAVLSTFILLGIYLLTSIGSVSLLGPEYLVDNQAEAISAVGHIALPNIIYKLLLIAVLTSAAASCQTTILPATRTMLSMGSHGAAPKKLAQINRRHLSPDFSTVIFGVISVLWYFFLVVVQHNTSFSIYDASILAVGLAISVYYGVSGLSCVWFFRRYLLKSTKNFFLIGVLPLFGGAVLIYAFVKTVVDSLRADVSAPGASILGIDTTLFIGTALLVLGIPLMLWCKAKYPAFFGFRADPPETVPDPYSENSLAEPLGTYTKDNRGKELTNVG